MSVSDDRLVLASVEAARGYISTRPGDPGPIVIGRFRLFVQHWARVVTSEAGDRVTTVGYQYQVQRGDVPLLEFHFHPGTGVDHCHVHAVTETPAWPDFRKLHIPTGRIALEDVLELLVRDFGLAARPNAITRLREQRRRLERFQQLER